MTQWTLNDWQSAISIAAMLGSWAAVVVIVWLTSKFPTRREFGQEREKRVAAERALTQTAGQLEHRMIKAEAAMERVPDAAALHELALAMARLQGQLAVTDANLSATNERLDTHHETLSRHESIFADSARGEPPRSRK